MEEVCIIENENHKKVSVIYHIDKQVYVCVILPLFDTKNAGKFVNQVWLAYDIHLPIFQFLIYKSKKYIFFYLYRYTTCY